MLLFRHMDFSVIAAVDKNYGIGSKGKIPWDLPSDLKYFNRVTKGNGPSSAAGSKNVVIMGRTTWESLPDQHRPLKDRVNIIMTRTLTPSLQAAEGPNVRVVQSLDDALKVAEEPEEIFVIGGAQIYAEAINHPACKRIYLTEIDAIFPECDAFFPKFDKNIFHVTKAGESITENGLTMRFNVYERVS